MPEAEVLDATTTQVSAPANADSVVLQNTPRLGLDSQLVFQCRPGMDCFGRCCHDVSILLTPYDALRLKKALGKDSAEFMEQYTSVMYSADKQVPVVFLKMDAESLACPFLGAEGCKVYGHRPWACRMYPLGMAEPAAANADARRFFFVVKEQLCHGHEGAEPRTVRDFIDSQGVEPYELSQSSFRGLLAAAGERKEPLTSQECAMYYMALYDLDRFRRFVFESSFLRHFEVAEERLETLRTDDDELLELAIDWLAFSIYRQRRMKLKQK